MQGNTQPNYKVYIQLALIFAVLIGFGITALVTSLIWLPILLFMSPFIIGFIALIKITKNEDKIKNIYFNVYDWIFYKSENTRKMMWGFIYNVMCTLYPNNKWQSMNYGYAILSNEGKLIQNLSENDEDERFCLQLYHICATKFGKLANLNDQIVLEVGCGRGGGLNYITNYLNPAKSIGLDYSQSQIDFCRQIYRKNEKIDFCQGDAENIEKVQFLTENSIDMVINVESSHCYGNFQKFVDQVQKVLKPGGIFAFTDFRTQQGYDEIKHIFSNKSWVIEKQEDITLNVVQSLKLDEKRRLALINGNVHKVIRPLFEKFSGVSSSRIYKEFEKRETLYFVFILRNNKQSAQQIK